MIVYITDKLFLLDSTIPVSVFKSFTENMFDVGIDSLHVFDAPTSKSNGLDDISKTTIASVLNVAGVKSSDTSVFHFLPSPH